MKFNGKFYMVAVPIGNLEEITYLGFRILRDTKVIFCEDTRVTKKLLDLLNIWNGQNLIKLNQFNEKECLEVVLEKLSQGDCVLVSDAGYPVIADPGFFLISDLKKLGASIQVINGPCAFIHAIVGSGVDSRRIFFSNFLTKKYLQRKKELENFSVILKEATVVYYETKNFIFNGLEIIKEVYGDIKICVARELSKLNESFYFDTISNLQQQIVLRGEFVVIIPRQDVNDDKEVSVDDVLQEVRNMVFKENIKLREACRKLKGKGGLSSKEIYSQYTSKYKN